MILPGAIKSHIMDDSSSLSLWKEVADKLTLSHLYLQSCDVSGA